MAGTIEVVRGTRWSAAGWLFDWTLEFLARNVADQGLRDQIREVVEENLGWLGLGDYGPDAEKELKALVTERLLPVADADLPLSLPNRADVLALLGELVALVAAERRPA